MVGRGTQRVWHTDTQINIHTHDTDTHTYIMKLNPAASTTSRVLARLRTSAVHTKEATPTNHDKMTQDVYNIMVHLATCVCLVVMELPNSQHICSNPWLMKHPVGSTFNYRPGDFRLSWFLAIFVVAPGHGVERGRPP